MIGDSIAAHWPGSIARWMGGPTQNLGVSGDTPRGLLWRLGLIQGHRSWKRILLIIGVNGAGSEPLCHDVAPAVVADIRALHRIAPEATLSVLAIMQVGEGLRPFRGQIADIDRRLADATGRERFTFIDPNPALLAACADKETCPLLLPDWIHPSGAGYDAIGPLVARAFGVGPATSGR
ncbi:GDSL-type esterase/lipase family protein [Acetobacteraceae bacterium KSS8]|uniref:GDSL-type esterase/lipase family protein n=1 Tax=Endosaccharibacter trunci TaxID=2812733 RepID=A0ABT1W387_9PROT|nr:GDSL-type esterase/lipase family protein [Acetobacteraceae bacterium KSS8]